MKDANLNFNDISLQVQFMQGKASQILSKQFLNSIMMAVMSKKSDASLSQKQEQEIFCHFIEDLLNFCF